MNSRTYSSGPKHLNLFMLILTFVKNKTVSNIRPFYRYKHEIPYAHIKISTQLTIDYTITKIRKSVYILNLCI